MISKIDLLIVGGCFPVQTNIPNENLYHFLLKEKIRNELSVKIEINILQYEKISPTYKKIKEVIVHKKIDLIIFHIRIEQILRMIKFYLRYHDKNDDYKRGLNLAIFSSCIPERKEFNLHHITENRNPKTIKFYNNFLKNINYILGYLVLNQIIAFRIYKKLIINIAEFCDNNSIDILFTGPVSRPVNSIENFTSVILDFYMNKLILNKSNKTYLKLFGTNHNSQYLFCNDHIRVNEIGHQRIANILFNAVKNILKS
jgi:hypothetical protein